MKIHSKLNLVFVLFLALAAALQPTYSAFGAMLDFGVDPANLGKGEWVYVLADATNHLQDPGHPSCYVDSVVDLPTLMAYFKTNLNLQYVVVKAGTGTTNFPSDAIPQFTADLVTAAHGQGLKIFGYTLTYGTDIPGELAIATNCFDAGADGFVLDAEDQLVDQGLTAGTAAAWNLCGQFKTNWPTRFLGESVYADIYFKWGSAANFPYKELGYWCDTVMPQVYWQSWSQSSSPTVRQYGTPVAAIQWADGAFSQYHNWLATQGTTLPTFKDPAGASWTNAIKPLAMIGQADVPGATNQTYADITNFVYYLKHDPSCVTPGGYQGCCFFRPGLQDTNNLLPGIAALSIGEPTITNPPVSLTNIAGTSATFSVGATGSGAIGYQWYENGAALVNGTNISGSSSPTLTLSSVQAGDAGDYSVVVSNFCGSVTSQVATLTVVLPPSITAQPQNANVLAGNNASLSVTASGNLPLTYQWLFNGASLPAATDTTLNLTNVQPTDAGSYSVIVTNAYGSVTSVLAQLQVAAAAVSVQPAGGLVLVGGNLSFAAAVTSTVPFTCQWQCNGTNLPGAAGPTLSLSNLQLSDAGSYAVVVSSTYGSVTSTPPTIVGVVAFPATNLTAASGSTVTFNVTVAGPGAFSYQWQANGTNLPNGIITTVAGNGVSGFSGDGGAATNARLYGPDGVAVDPDGNLYISDSANHRVRRVDGRGIITTVAGNGTLGYSGDGGLATNAQVGGPVGLALDAGGNLYIVDGPRIRKMDTNGILTIVAGTNTGGFSGDGQAAVLARLAASSDVAVDTSGNLFIADYNNQRVRKVDTNGIISTFAGKSPGGFSGDGGPATNASMGYPCGVAVDAAGNLFIADQGDHRVRKVDTNGIITTVAGTGAQTSSGDGGPAINAAMAAFSVRVDTLGNLFVGDFQRLRKIDTNGIITTVVGSGLSGYAGDGGAATNAKLTDTRAIALDVSGNIFIADTYNQRIRKVFSPGYPTLAVNYLTTNSPRNYSVVVSSPYGSVTSAVSVITVLTWPPVITAPPVNANVTLGSSASFSVSATGDLPLQYQWQFNGTDLPGATASFLNLSNVQASDIGYYQVVVTNPGGLVTSLPALLAPLVTNADGSMAAPPNLQNWWPAEHNAHDVLGGSDGTAYSGVSYTSGECGQAFSFNGATNGLISLGAAEIPPPWSACFWVKRQAYGVSGALIGDFNSVLKLNQNPSTGLVGLTRVGVGDYTFNYSVPSNTWTHLVFVGTATNTSLYTNGVFQGSITQSCSLPRGSLGGWTTPTGRAVDNMVGQLDEVMLFNRLLSPAEISALYIAGSAGLWRIPQFQAGATSDGALSWTLQGLSGKTFTVYGSSNLTTWQALFTLPNPYGFIQFTDTPAAPQWFYRATQP